MKKFLKPIIGILVIGGISLLLVGKGNVELAGTYNTNNTEGKNVIITVDDDEKTFVQYIDQREVDKGLVSEEEGNIYRLKSDKQEVEIKLNDNDSFDMVIKGVNEKGPINLKKLTTEKQYFSTTFGDEDEYKESIDIK
ncbi:MAG: hypothetical protein ACRDAU_05510 [Clostridium sp.]